MVGEFGVVLVAEFVEQADKRFFYATASRVAHTPKASKPGVIAPVAKKLEKITMSSDVVIR
jgi:hypothetical protein